MITFRLATEADARAVGGSLREVDRLEIERGGTGHTPLSGAQHAIETSMIAWCAEEGGRPMAVFGVAPHHGAPGLGIVWLLATPGVEAHAREFILNGRYYVGLMSRLFQRLYNLVDAENLRTRRWLKRLGFVEGEAVFGKITNHPFIPVTYTRPSCASQLQF